MMLTPSPVAVFFFFFLLLHFKLFSDQKVLFLLPSFLVLSLFLNLSFSPSSFLSPLPIQPSSSRSFFSLFSLAFPHKTKKKKKREERERERAALQLSARDFFVILYDVLLLNPDLVFSRFISFHFIFSALILRRKLKNQLSNENERISFFKFLSSVHRSGRKRKKPKEKKKRRGTAQTSRQ